MGIVYDFLHDTALGITLRICSNNRLFTPPELEPGFTFSEELFLPSTSVSLTEQSVNIPADKTPFAKENTTQTTIVSPTSSPLLLVSWYSDVDPEKPMNWSTGKKILNSLVICTMSFCVYMGSATYTSTVHELMSIYNISYTLAILGLSLFIGAYGIGPLFLGPLSEVPFVGRNGVYVVTMGLYFLFMLLQSVVKSFPALMVLRFLAGFVGSPTLSTGAATFAEMYDEEHYPYALIMWDIMTVAGPTCGPIVGGYAVMLLGVEATFWIMTGFAGLGFLATFCFLSETYEPNILLRRARRLRKATGNSQIFIKEELKHQEKKNSQCGESVGDSDAQLGSKQKNRKEVLKEYLVRPFVLFFEPILLFCNVYMGLVYGVYYLWFEAFPYVYANMYSFNLGEQGLPFLGIFIGSQLASFWYLWYVYTRLAPKLRKSRETGVSQLTPEDRVFPAVIGSFFIPVSLFIFGWTSNPKIHYMASIVGSSLFIPGVFLLFQCIFTYLPLAYPKYCASVFGMNGAIRSLFGFSFPLFAMNMYEKLGVDISCSILGAISAAMIFVLYFMLYKNGDKLRLHSKYAEV